ISNITYYSPYPSFGIIGGAGADLLSLDDRTTPYTGNYTLTPTLLIRDSIYFGYQTIETLNVSAGTQDNKITVTPSATTTFNIDGDLGTYMGGDNITVDLTGVTGTDFSGGPGSGTYTFTNRMPVTFSEIARDLTPWGPTVKSSAFNYNTKQS